MTQASVEWAMGVYARGEGVAVVPLLGALFLAASTVTLVLMSMATQKVPKSTLFHFASWTC